jgi:hypothetical protein
VPVEQGVLLNSTAEGSGAHAAGLQKGDVLVSLNGVALRDPGSFPNALQGLKAGDRPLVEYYRGPEKHTTPLELGVFPIPELPPDASGLAARVRQLNTEVTAALRAQLEGLSETQAARRPGQDEWSVHELVAHFILMERDYQSWAADMLNDTPIEDYLQMRPNVTPRISALIRRFGTLPALLGELELAREETVALIEALPPDFVRDRKHLFRRLAQWELEIIPGHYFDEHQEQFAAAIAASQAE